MHSGVVLFHIKTVKILLSKNIHYLM